MSREPNVFEHYKALAEARARAGHDASANLALGLGYLRAKGLLTLARGKLGLAAATDPNCPGLAEAQRELALKIAGEK